VVRGALLARWWQLGGIGGPLGYPTGDDAAVPGGFTTTFAGGALFWSAGTGAHMLRGAILDRYVATGGSKVLGFPTADDGPTSANNGAWAPVQGGAVYWSAATGAHVVRGALLARWWQLGGIGGPLGYPTGDDAAVPGGFTTAFAGGALFWSAGTGAHMLRGAILGRYATLGGSATMGFPVGDDGPTTTAGGAVATFTGGSLSATAATPGGAIYWSPATGAHGVWGDIWHHWLAAGAQASPYGYPVADQTVDGTGTQVAEFQHGRLSQPAAGAVQG
jgi:uncharacterized protein with LGFP repeats